MVQPADVPPPLPGPWLRGVHDGRPGGEPTGDLAGFLDAVPAWEASSSLVVVATGPELRLAYQNAASRERFGERELGAPLWKAFPEFSADGWARVRRVRDEGVAIVEPVVPAPVRTPDGEEMYLTRVFAPLGGPAVGRPVGGVVLTAVDVTAQVRLEEEGRRARMLSEVTDRMNGASDPDLALQELTGTLVPALADVAAVYVLPGREQVARASGDAVPPAALSVAAPLLARLGPPPPTTRRAEPSPIEHAVATGRPLVLDVDSPLDRTALDAGPSGRWLRAAGVHSLAVLPLLVAGELSGAVVLAAAGERPRYRPVDLDFLQSVATRAGASVAHLRAFRRQRQLAIDLQHALLPRVPAGLPGMRAAVRFVPGSDDVDVGGDWWDVQALPAGGIGVGVGDVAGRGVPAAALMGQARAAMHALAQADPSPGRLLRHLDAQLADLLAAGPEETAPARPSFATATFAVVDPVDEILRVATAGHPPLLVLRPDGTAHRAQAPPGLPLGLGGDGYEEVVVPFPAGSTLVAFTDGLVESRSRDVESGICRLEELLPRLDPSDVEAAADVVLDALVRFGGHDDDVALVLLTSDA